MKLKYKNIYLLVFVAFFSFQNAYSQCVAKIGNGSKVELSKDSVLQGCDPLAINFNELTTGAISRSWKVSPKITGSPFVSTSPSISFPAGTKSDTLYTVTLVSQCAVGKDSVSVKVKVLRKPTGTIIASKDTACQLNDEVQFQVNSASVIKYYNWDLNNEKTENVSNPSFAFQKEGYKYVQAIVVDENNCSATLRKDSIVYIVKLPNPQFTSSAQTGCIPFNVTLTNSTTDANITSWLWDFGDGTTSATKSPGSKTYSTAKNNIGLKLTATNIAGCSNTTSQVFNAIFTPTATFSVPSVICQKYSNTVSYTGTSNLATRYTWTFGNTSNILAGSKSGPFTIKWDSEGITSVTLTTLDTLTNCSNTVSKSINVKAIPKLKIKNSANGLAVCANSTITFTGEPSLYDKYIFRVNGTVVQQTADNVFNINTLKNNDKVSVEIDNGCGDIVKDSVIIQIKARPVVSISSSDANNQVYKGTSIKFTASPSNFESYDFVVNNQIVKSSASNEYITDTLVDLRAVSVIAYNIGCSSDSSNKIITRVINPFIAPNITAKTTVNTILLNWTKVLNDLGQDPIGYQISINGAGYINPNSGFNKNATTHLVSGLTPGDSIKVKIKTIAGIDEDTLGNSKESAIYTFYAVLCDPVAFIPSPSQTLCAGDSAKLQIFGLNGVTGSKYSILWNKRVVTKTNFYNYVPTESEIVSVRVIDSTQLKCVFQNFIQVNVKPVPEISLDMQPTKDLVQGKLVTFTATSPNTDLYLFFNGQKQVQSSSNSIYKTTKLKNGDIIYVKGTLNGCTSLSSNSFNLNINNSVGVPVVSLDTATNTSLTVKWTPVSGATGYLIQVDGKTFVIPNGEANSSAEISHYIQGLTKGQNVSIVVKAFNDFDTTTSAMLTTSAGNNCRAITVELASNSPVCIGDSAKVFITNTPQNYLKYSWENGSLTTAKDFSFIFSKTDTVTLKAVDNADATCFVITSAIVNQNSASICSNKLNVVDINVDTMNSSGIKINWDTKNSGAQTYILEVNGKQTVISGTSADVNGIINQNLTGFNNGQQVTIVVKSVNGKDTVSSNPIITNFNPGCRALEAELNYPKEVCSNGIATITIVNTLPSYVRTSWQGNTPSVATTFTFKPLVKTTVSLVLSDSENSKCTLTKSVTINVDQSANCVDYNNGTNVNVDNNNNSNNTNVTIKDKLLPAIVGVDTTTTSSVVFSWQTVKGAQGYQVSVNGAAFKNYTQNITADKDGYLYYSQSGLQSGATVSLVVKAFNGTDTSTSLIVYGTALDKCGFLNYDITYPSSVCSGDSAKLSISTALPIDYKVYWNGSTTVNSRNFALKPISSTLVYVTVINPAQPLCEVKKYVTVKMNAVSSITLSSSAIKDSIFEGQPITFKASPSGLDNYEFIQKNTSVQNSANNIYSTSNIENNSVVFVNATSGACVGKSNSITITVKKNLTSPNISATSTANSVSLSWNQVKGATKYQISVNGGQFTDVNSGTTSKDTTHSITGLSPDSTLTFVVKALTNDPNGYGSSLSNTWVQTTIVCKGIDFRVSADTTICTNGIANLKVLKPTSGKYSYSWAGGTPSAKSSYSIKPLKSINVQVQLIDNDQVTADTGRFVCPYFRTINVKVNDSPVISIDPIDTVGNLCSGQAFKINALPSNLDTYTFVQKGVTKNVIVPTYDVNAGSFNSGDTIKISGVKNGCASTNTYLYIRKVNPLPVTKITSDVVGNACQSKSVTYSTKFLKATTFKFYESDLLVQSGPDTSYTKSNLKVETQNPVSVYAIDSKTGCVSNSKDFVKVTVEAFTDVALTTASSTVCDKSLVEFTASQKGAGNSLTRYRFVGKNGKTLQDSTINKYSTSKLEDGDSISVFATNTKNCESPASNTFKMIVKPISVPKIQDQDTFKVCNGSNVIIKAKVGKSTKPVVTWIPAGTNVNTGDTIYTFTNKYTLSSNLAIVKSDLNNCITYDTAVVLVDLETKPNAKITIKDINKSADSLVTIPICQNQTRDLIASGSTKNNYQWYDGDFKSVQVGAQYTLAPKVDAPIESILNYYIVATNLACKDTAKAIVKILSCSPTAQIITPNGDGNNDVWKAFNSDSDFDIDGVSYLKNTLTIFNRWGNEVYATSNYSNNWGGVNNNGNPLPEGTYFYVLKVDGRSDKVGYIVIKY